MTRFFDQFGCFQGGTKRGGVGIYRGIGALIVGKSVDGCIPDFVGETCHASKALVNYICAFNF